MEDLFEPELVGLMNCYEKKFIVVFGIRETFLQRNQIRNTKVFVV
jgi:hypothetical protein